MEPNSPTIKNSESLQFWKNMNGAQKMVMITMAVLTLIAVLAAAILNNPASSSSSSFAEEDSRNHHLNSVIKKACANTLYTSLCFTTLSSIPSPVSSDNNQTVLSFHYILEFAINQTKKHVLETQVSSISRFQNQSWSSQQQNAIKDCMEMLDQTQYELEQAIENLHQFPESVGYLPRSYGYLKVLLSAAMTNGYSCIDGLSDLEALDSEAQKEIKKHFQVSLNPISQMISNCLAMITDMEKVRRQETMKNPRMLLMKIPEDRLLDWMSVKERKMMQMKGKLSPDVIVACDGSGNYSKIGEAIALAPNFSKIRYAIGIKAGIYEENVIIPREKTNLMLMGDGMNSTIIAGSRNIVDGFSTFASATLSMLKTFISLNFQYC
ncbi:OLC1v1033779C1 [Oldenlandia corymbosa var. corymbosa]|uniref:OLC1v1033779C1 n=1 Tax=Oldenlandia corymbosa var. corymbosa TaxID=529605 RepID=A0AAV1CP66_OLDCO|nr:OLC1v1033779C1 [Oldenlandia corymbosa var. corymbosa]